ncbi:MAG: hypothetical protein QXN55_06940, partial [Candidatus Nitrosotenuis sp.]
MKYFIILLAVTGFIGIASAEPPPASPELSISALDEKYFQTLYDDHDLILDGTVTNHTGDRFAKYKIEVHQYFKNDLGLKEIDAKSDRAQTGFMT